MRQAQKILLIVIAVLVVLALIFRMLSRGRKPLRLAEGACDTALWDHVYHPQRLRVIEACKVVEGTIVSLRKEADGDFHIRMDVDGKSLLNERNLAGQHGDLVLEPVCANEVTQADAVEACRAFTSSVTIPRVGDRVRVTGAYVTDLEHGWNEIHPVTQMEILPDGTSLRESGIPRPMDRSSKGQRFTPSGREVR